MDDSKPNLQREVIIGNGHFSGQLSNDLPSFERGSTLKGEQIHSLIRVDFFSKGSWEWQEKEQEVTKVVSLVQNGRKPTRCICLA